VLESHSRTCVEGHAPPKLQSHCFFSVESSWNVMAHGDAEEGKWRGNWRMEWVASTLTPPRNMLYPALLSLMRAPRLSVVDWTDAPADLNGLVRFGERRDLVSAHVPLHSNAVCNLLKNSVSYSLCFKLKNYTLCPQYTVRCSLWFPQLWEFAFAQS
jgi:hypothetical protein